MPLIAGIDLGTTKVTAIAVDIQSGEIVSAANKLTDGNVTSPEDRLKGRSEWDANAILQSGIDCLSRLTDQLGDQSNDVVSLGVTGQQHGMVLVDASRQPVSPFINWQDQRGNEQVPGMDRSWVEEARDRVGVEAVTRTGCRLNTGFMATTLFCLKEQGQLTEVESACFIMDLFTAMLTGRETVTEPTVAGSAGVLNVGQRDWDDDSLTALGLNRRLFPGVKEADVPAGTLLSKMAEVTGLPREVPVSLPIGDHQASFLGSISDVRKSVLLNVGTGAQVAVYSEQNDIAPPVELRPFPIQGNLLSNVGLTGGWSFQVVENLVRQFGVELFEASSDVPVYEGLTRLAQQASPDCGGLTCVPTFSGTRSDPTQTGAFVGATPENLTPANLARAVLNGMARNYREALDQVRAIRTIPDSSMILAGAGNGIRENPILAQAVTNEFGITPMFTRHREEAAFGAALVGAVSAGVFDSIESASRLVRYN